LNTPLPQIAIVGRPNVGKSSLLNRLARRRVSIVDPTPGVTRDRVSAIIEIDPPVETPRGTPAHLVEIIDTGGWGVYTAEGRQFDDVGEDLSRLTGDIERQIRLAMDKADLIVFVIDAQQGMTSLDETVARLLHRSGYADKVILVANKVDGDSWEQYAAEASSLGFGEPVCVSAVNGFNMRRFTETLWDRVEQFTSQTSGVESQPSDSDSQVAPASERRPEFTFAIIGKRNAGKSTLLNALAGEERAIVSEIAGTTRDSIDVRFEFEGHTMIAIDTAGVRKRRSMKEDVEYYSWRRVLDAIRRADVCILLIDATEPVSQVDQKLSQELQEQFKPTLIVVNKWDLVDESNATSKDYLDYLSRELRGLDYAPIIFISAKSGDGLRDLVALTLNLYQQASHRESTGQLNRTVERVLADRGPSSRLGTQAKLYFVSQVSTNPPTIVFMVNDPELFRGRYERYLLNRLRDELAFSEVPIRLIFRARSRKSLEELKSGARFEDS